MGKCNRSPSAYGGSQSAPGAQKLNLARRGSQAVMISETNVGYREGAVKNLNFNSWFPLIRDTRQKTSWLWKSNFSCCVNRLEPSPWHFTTIITRRRYRTCPLTSLFWTIAQHVTSRWNTGLIALPRYELLCPFLRFVQVKKSSDFIVGVVLNVNISFYNRCGVSLSLYKKLQAHMTYMAGGIVFLCLLHYFSLKFPPLDRQNCLQNQKSVNRISMFQFFKYVKS